MGMNWTPERALLAAREHTWWRGRGERVACAFANGPGWLRSACGDVLWSVALLRVREGQRIRRCPGCVVALTTGASARPAMSEGEAREAFGA
jgi:hypothetical protein